MSDKGEQQRQVVCFIDDDPDELERFRTAMSGRYQVITATNMTACRDQLATLGRKRPDLWVLDLFFPIDEGAGNTPEQLTEMNSKYLALYEQVNAFSAFLRSINQGPEGGRKKLRECRSIGSPVVMLTRKGSLDDVVSCLDDGAAAVLKKPMPAGRPSDPNAMKAAMDRAMADNAGYLIDHFENVIREHRHWARHRAKYIFIFGIALGTFVRWAFGLLLARIA